MQREADEHLPGDVAREQVLVEGELEFECRATDCTGDERERDEPQVEARGAIATTARPRAAPHRRPRSQTT